MSPITAKSDRNINKMLSFSDEYGLHLVLGHVSEESPAYASGVRSGDVIVKVNDWLITVMDRPQVNISTLHLLSFVYPNPPLTGSSSPVPSRCKHCQAGYHQTQRKAA